MILPLLYDTIWPSFCDTEGDISSCEWILWTERPVWTLNQIYSGNLILYKIIMGVFWVFFFYGNLHILISRLRFI